MSPLLAAAFALFLYLLVRLLNMTHPAAAPLIYAKDRSSQFVQSVLDMCPILHQPYHPPFLWGKSGHIQTIVYARMGRLNVPVPDGVRHAKVMPDGANLTFDLYEPFRPHPTGESHCIIFCPGIGNNSESPYIQSLVHHSQQLGYIAVVLNHLGSLKNMPLTSPRLFTYGGTEELAAVRAEVERIHPGCHLILVGCSMGANIVLKYLGEDQAHQKGILAAVSVNQGYDVNKAVPILKGWQNMGRFYVYVMTENQKQIIRAHQDQLLSPKNKEKHGIDEQKIWQATSLDDLDEAFTIQLFGYKSVKEYYHEMSCYRHIPNIKIPLLILNAEDDPVVPKELLVYPLKAAETQPYTIFVLTKHGGHLGFYERGFFRPSEHTWMDRLIMEYSEAITNLHNAGKLPRLMMNAELSDKTDEKIGLEKSVAAINNNTTLVDELSALRNKGKLDEDLDHILPIINHNFTSGDVAANVGGMLSAGDGLTSKHLVLEALRKSTNTAQL